jgi:hypothetical protein
MFKKIGDKFFISFFLLLAATSCTSKNAELYNESNDKIEILEESPVIGGYVFEQYTKNQFKNFLHFNLTISLGKCMDLEGIEQLENIETLVLFLDIDGDIDFSGLQSLRKLKGLYLSGRLSKIPDLSRVIALESLSIENACLKSLDGLENLYTLKSILISANHVPLTDTTSLQHLKELKYIKFAYGTYNINFKGMSVLSGLENLIFYGCDIIDLSDIGMLQSLKRLGLYSNTDKLIDGRSSYLYIEQVGKLTGLKEIYLDETISSIEFLAENINLERITLVADEEREDFWDLSRQLPLDVSPLKDLKYLKFFRSRGFALTNLAILEKEEGLNIVTELSASVH